MTMQLRIVHTTGFEYAGKATASFNEARLTPQTTPGQIVVHTRLEVHPTPWTYSYRDYWGTQVSAFEVFDPHESLTVTATATVHTDRAAPSPATLSWADLADPRLRDDLVEYLHLPKRVTPAEDLVVECRRIAAAGDLPGDVAREVCALVHREVKYVSGTTDVKSLAAEAWANRTGVCQDMAHLVIGALRTLGIPARYVSGYLHPKPSAPVGDAVRGESHAWVEWWDDGWHGFDPTNDADVSDQHVVVATGRDYADVRPLSGIFSGSGTSDMFVDVQVTRLQ
jgi:transglutaminase-like putative cysteine protease